MSRLLAPARLAFVGAVVLAAAGAVLHALDRPALGSTMTSLALAAVVVLLSAVYRVQRATLRAAQAQRKELAVVRAALPSEADVARLRADMAEMTRRVLTALSRSQQEWRSDTEELGDVVALVQRVTTETLHEVHGVARDVEASEQLRSRIQPRAPLPPTGGWAIDAHSMQEIASLIERERPQRVLELGSGTSTVWLGYLLERSGGRLVTVDHLPEYADLTRRNVTTHMLDGTVEVRLGELGPTELDGRSWPWYAMPPFDDQHDVDLLLVDGPPSGVGPLARYPALPLLVDRLADTAWVVLDDARRADEKQTFARWLDEVPGLERIATSSENLCVLRYARPRAAVEDPAHA